MKVQILSGAGYCPKKNTSPVWVDEVFFFVEPPTLSGDAPKKKSSTKAKTAKKVADNPVAAKSINKIEDSVDNSANTPDVSDDSLVKLLVALAIRAKYSSNAAAIYEQVKQILMR
ncbi:MAG: hypothetical protein FWG45_07455 [Oscillospiraceae bacterium]|nr:hypothetical protein [Oscillospiraceae bacterium]